MGPGTCESFAGLFWRLRRLPQGIKQIASCRLFPQGATQLITLPLSGLIVAQVHIAKAVVNDVSRYFHRNSQFQPMAG